MSQSAPQHNRIHVATNSARYDVCVGTEIGQILSGILDGSHTNCVAFVDQTVMELHGERLHPLLPSRTAVIAPGESSKSLQYAAKLYAQLAEWKIERNGILLAIGGGVVTDLVGFVAATWMRGVSYISLPTTLEAAIDASVGGKTAINHPAGKNLIGAFHHPSAVLIDTVFLETLSERDLIAGLAESVKHALLSTPAFVEWHETHIELIRDRDAVTLAELISRNVQIKAKVVMQDEHEKNRRAILNYGHTLGHAFEYLLEYEFRHGECVALGIAVENEIAVRAGVLREATATRALRLLSRLGLPTRLPRVLDAQAVLSLCRTDKKVRNGKLRLALLREIGDPILTDAIPETAIADALAVVQP